MKTTSLIALLLILIYGVAFCAVCFIKYQTFSYHDSDLGVINQVMWNTLHGRFFYTSVFGCSILKLHLSLIFAVLLPTYALWQSPLMLLYSQTFLLALSGVPIYLVARRELDNKNLGLFFLALYLLYPALGYVTLGHIEEHVLAIFFLAWAYYFYRANRYALFLLMLGVTLVGREEYALLAITFGINALWDRKGRKWWLPLFIGSCTWLVTYFFIIAPSTWGTAASPFEAFYAEAGGSVENILKNIIFHPLSITSLMFTPPKLLYLFHLLAPLAFTPLLSPRILFIISPVIFLNLLATRPGVATIINKYNAPIIPFIFFASIATLAKLRRLRIVTLNRAVIFVLCITGVAASWRFGPQLHLFSRSWHGLADLLPRYDFLVPHKQEIVNRIPPNAPAATNFGFFAHLSNRRDLAAVPWIIAGRLGPLPLPYESPNNTEYALIDLGDATTFVRFYNPQNSAERFRRFLSDNRLGLVTLYDQIALFKRDAPDIFPLYESIQGDNSAKPIAEFNGLELKDARLTLTGPPTQREITFTSTWRAGKPLYADFSAMIMITDAAGRSIFPHQVRNICHHLYPTWEWKEGETIRATHLIALPPYLPPGHYFLKMAIINKFPPCVARRCMADTRRIDQNGWYIVGAVDL